MVTWRQILSSVNEWLMFAEAKNAILASVSSLALWSLIRLVVIEDLTQAIKIYITSLILFLSFSLIIALISFLPVLHYKFIIPKSKNKQHRNLLYFDYLSKLSKRELLTQYYSAKGDPNAAYGEIESMYAEQIIMNARITTAKFKIFRYGVSAVLLGVLTPFIGVFLLYFINNSRSKMDGYG